MVMGSIWEASGKHLGASGDIWEASGRALGELWEALGAPWGSGRLWEALGASGAPRGKFSIVKTVVSAKSMKKCMEKPRVLEQVVSKPLRLFIQKWCDRPFR